MPAFEIDFERLSEMSNIETIGKIKSVSKRNWLNAQYGRSNWIYKKGFAKIQVKDDGKVWMAEFHFYTAHGKGRYLEKVKRLLERVYE